MTARRITRRRMSNRRLSFRRSSEPDASESYHHRRLDQNNIPNPKTLLKKTSSFLRRSSFASSVTSSFNSDVDGSDDVDYMAIDPVTQALAVEAAKDSTRSLRASLPESIFRDHDVRDCVAPFEQDEILVGPKLGSGEYSNVYEVSSFYLSQDFDDETSLSVKELGRRTHLKKHQKYRNTQMARYALKHIKEDYFLKHDSESYVQAASDLALEAELLASLVHPNIIKLRGIAHAGADGFAQGPSGYFLVIDRLFETLDQRMMKWRDPTSQGVRMRGFRRRMSCMPSISSAGEDILREYEPPKKNYHEILDERLNTAFQISAAMQYLHKHSIIFRDLKPANIGFDVRGDVKIFDFGLARVMPDGDANNDLFSMSGAGSPRYMAPELLSGDDYNFKADVYSFSVVLWEILSGETPYIFCKNMHQLIQHVVHEGGRLSIDDKWPSPIQGMLESSFDSEIGKRPKMDLWYNIIREVLASLRGGDESGLNDTHVYRRRTIDSMKNVVKDL